jgi:hypothetical protein
VCPEGIVCDSGEAETVKSAAFSVKFWVAFGRMPLLAVIVMG